MLTKLLNIFTFIFLINIVYANEDNKTCSRKAIFKNKEVLVDGYTGIKGSGLNDILKNNSKAYKHLKNYQRFNDTRLLNLVSGSVSSASILTGLLYTGDKSNKSNFLLFGGIVALLNFLTTKTVQFYNERELMLAIEEHNKGSKDQIRLLNSSQMRQPTPSIFLDKNWSF